ncbi:hypothetical protein GCM10010191_11220 [Actinomadura vinacea]|uniref:DUF4913 domain-containing protein n=1 Tax=Actinomadura vinacea TaxID=115336 RepID=A0ABN3IJL2_9ACTN
MNEPHHLLTIIKAQQEAIDRLMALVQERKQPEPAKRKERRERPIDWLTISEKERAAAWRGLAAFVESLVFRYGLQMEIQPCWWRHAEAVEELTALWQVRQNAFGENATLGSGMQWQNAFHSSRKRLSTMFGSCRSGHIDSTVTMWMTEDDRKAFDHAVENGL